MFRLRSYLRRSLPNLMMHPPWLFVSPAAKSFVESKRQPIRKIFAFMILVMRLGHLSCELSIIGMFYL